MIRIAHSTLDASVRVADVRAEPAELAEEITSMYDRFRRPLLRYLGSFGLDSADSEEIIQEVFLSLFQHLRKGKSGENLPAWIYRVAHNLALRQRGRDRQQSDRIAQPGLEHLAIDPAPNPEDGFAMRQTQAHLVAVVNALPELDRRCIFLRAEGLRYREIGRILDMSLGAVAVSIARSLARMARCAERYNP